MFMNSDIIIVPTIFIVFLLIIRNWLDYLLRAKIVEKGVETTEQVEILVSRTQRDSAYSSLKWGLLVFGVGAGLLVGSLIYRFGTTFSEEIMPALMFIFAGIALMLYYFIARSWSARDGA